MADSNDNEIANHELEEKSNKAEEEFSSQPEGPPTPPANDFPSPGQWFNSYFGGEWMTKAKEQTLNTLESVKKDLNEFTDTVQHEMSAIANATGKTVKQQAELFQQFVTTPDVPESPQEKTDAGNFGLGWMKSVVDTVKSMAIEDTAKEEEQFTDQLQIGKRNTALDQFQLLEFQNNEQTFLKSPAQNVELYKEWLQEFRLSEYNGEINILLGSNPKLREIYAKVVPTKVDNYTFWNRYFFKVYVAEMEKDLRLNANKAFEQLTLDTGNSSTAKLKAENKKEDSEVSPANTENESSWSVCSSGADDLQELPDEVENAEEKLGGLLTPKALNDSPADEWENWDQKEKKEPPSRSSC